MISKSTLQEAAEQNIIEPAQVEPLYKFISQNNSDSISESREEPLRFIRSFGDVFITLGVVLLVISINLANLSAYAYLIPAAGFVAVAEWLVRVRRLALPGIAILLSILFFVHKAFAFSGDNAALYSFAVLALTSLLFYLRYRMPFSLLPLAASLVAMAVYLLGFDVIETPAIFAFFGLLVFAVALWFDAQDTKRLSHLSDSAFWLHLLASPLIVHGMMVSMLLSDQAWIEFIGKEIIIIVFFAGFFLLALLVDRRAMLISTQLYIIYALTQLFKDRVTTTQDVMIYVLIVLGLFVIYFGAYWYKARRVIFGRLSSHSISRYVPDLNIEDTRR